MLARVMTPDPTVIELTIALLGVAAVFQISDGLQAVGSGALRGTGDTRFPFIANLLGHWLVGLPVAIYLGNPNREDLTLKLWLEMIEETRSRR